MCRVGVLEGGGVEVWMGREQVMTVQVGVEPKGRGGHRQTVNSGAQQTVDSVHLPYIFKHLTV